MTAVRCTARKPAAWWRTTAYTTTQRALQRCYYRSPGSTVCNIMVAMRTLLLALCAVAAIAAPIRVYESGFHPGPDGNPAGWTTWSARAETAPRCFVDTLRYRSGPGSLAINGASNIAEHGGWERTV